MHELTRKQFLLTVAGAGATAAMSTSDGKAESPGPRVKLGVTLFSYTGSYAPNSLLETCVAEASAIGAEGIEILSDVHIPGYPNPQSRWIEHWRELTKRYKTAPSCYCCPVNPRLQAAGGPGSREAMRMLVRDLELAGKLGFGIVRPAWDNARPEEWRDMAMRAQPYADKYGVRLAVETPSLNTAGLDGYLQLVAKVTTRRLGLLVDVGRLSAAEEKSASERLAALLPHIIHVRRTVPGPYVFRNDVGVWERRQQAGEGGENQANLIRLLVKGGYGGYLSGEYEGPRAVAMASNHLSRQHAQLRRLLVAV